MATEMPEKRVVPMWPIAEVIEWMAPLLSIDRPTQVVWPILDTNGCQNVGIRIDLPVNGSMDEVRIMQVLDDKGLTLLPWSQDERSQLTPAAKATLERFLPTFDHTHSMEYVQDHLMGREIVLVLHFREDVVR